MRPRQREKKTLRGGRRERPCLNVVPVQNLACFDAFSRSDDNLRLVRQTLLSISISWNISFNYLKN